MIMNTETFYNSIKNKFNDFKVSMSEISAYKNSVFISRNKTNVFDKTYLMVEVLSILQTIGCDDFKLGIQYGDEGGEYYGYGTVNTFETDGIVYTLDGDVDGMHEMTVADFINRTEDFDDMNDVDGHLMIKNMDGGGDYYGYRECSYVEVNLKDKVVILG